MSGGVVSGREALALALHRLTCDPNCVNVDAEDYEDADALLASGAVREEAAVRPTTLREVITEAMDDAERVGMDRRTTEEWVSIRILGSSRIPLRPTALAPQDPA